MNVIIKGFAKKIPGLRNFYREFIFPVKQDIVNFYGSKVLAKRKNFIPQILTMVDGGLGSQMWQFALGYAASRASGLPVKYDISWFDNCGMDINGKETRKFNLVKVFPSLPFTSAFTDENKLYKKYFFWQNYHVCDYNEKVLKSIKARYLGGYYCNCKYFDGVSKDIKKFFIFPEYLLHNESNAIYYQQMLSCNCPMAVHIRRGDYVGSIHDVTTPQYFYRAIELMKSKLEKPVFFVFSNDLEYCKTMLHSIDGDFVYVTGNGNNQGASDMALMTQCRHFIISNSSFSWWPAWLSNNDGKIVVAPDRWFAQNTGSYAYNETAMLCDGWIPVSVD